MLRLISRLLLPERRDEMKRGKVKDSGTEYTIVRCWNLSWNWKKWFINTLSESPRVWKQPYSFERRIRLQNLQDTKITIFVTKGLHVTQLCVIRLCVFMCMPTSMCLAFHDFPQPPSAPGIITWVGMATMTLSHRHCREPGRRQESEVILLAQRTNAAFKHDGKNVMFLFLPRNVCNLQNAPKA